MSSGWLSRNRYLIRMSYDNVIMSSGWHRLPFLSHPDEIVNFDFPHHAVALQRFRTIPVLWWQKIPQCVWNCLYCDHYPEYHSFTIRWVYKMSSSWAALVRFPSCSGQNDWKLGFRIIIWKTDHQIHFKIGVSTYYIRLQKLFVFGQRLHNFGPLLLKNKYWKIWFPTIIV